MRKMYYELVDRLAPMIRRGELGACEQCVREAFDLVPHSPFHTARQAAFSNDPNEVATYCDRFLQGQAGQFNVAAVYLEMNGFEINTDRWYFDLFAFAKYGGHEDYDWLCDWQSEQVDGVTLRGMEALQEVFANNYGDKGKAFRDAADLASLMVALKFQQLIGRAVEAMETLSCPLLAAAHDNEFTVEFRR